MKNLYLILALIIFNSCSQIKPTKGDIIGTFYWGEDCKFSEEHFDGCVILEFFPNGSYSVTEYYNSRVLDKG